MAKKRPLDFNHHVIEISVGKGIDHRRFTTQRTLLRRSSEVMKRRFSAETPTVRLSNKTAKENATFPDENPDCFNTYLNWLHTGSIMITNWKTFLLLTDMRGLHEDAEYRKLAELYKFGHNVEDKEFKNAVVDRFHDKATGQQTPLPGRYCIGIVYEMGTMTSNLAKLLVKIYATSCTPKRLEEARNRLPMEFVQDLAIELLKLRQVGEDMWEMSKEPFHEHDDHEGEDSGNEDRPRKRKRLRSPSPPFPASPRWARSESPEGGGYTSASRRI